MSRTRQLALAAVLLATTVYAWIRVIRSAASAPMHREGALAFTLQWGVMMAAMMLPSAAPMVMLYGGASRRANTPGGRAISPELFAFVYLVLWLLTGIPVYLASVGIGRLVAERHEFGALIPYGIAGVLLAAGIYQLTPLKRACLRQCQSPMDFMMREWRSGYAGSFRLAALHAAYCIGCCWALMLLLVAAGAMSLAWVLSIALVVFAEKILPYGERTARVIGIVLVLAAIALAFRPELAGTLRVNEMR